MGIKRSFLVDGVYIIGMRRNFFVDGVYVFQYVLQVKLQVLVLFPPVQDFAEQL